MQAVAEQTPYLAEFDRVLTERAGSEPEPVHELRRSAIERFREAGFPTIKQEAWRNTNVKAIAQGGFTPVAKPARLSQDDLAPHLYAGTSRLTFVDGRYAPELSSPPELPAGVFVGSLAQALQEHPGEVLEHLGRYATVDGSHPYSATVEDHAFAALNSAYFADGVFLYLPKGAVVEEPIQLLFIAATPGAAIYPRLLLVAGENSQATVVEHYVAATDEAYFTCPVTEMVLADNAVLDHYKVQKESLAAHHVAVQQSYQRRSSTLRSHSVSVGGGLVRNDLNAVLDAEGITCILNGLYLVDGEQHVDNHMRVDHAQPNCYSHELYKGVLNGKARSVFNGLIHVHEDAQKTDAVQSNRNLLLSSGALASSNPQLEIFADDVRCTHGSTIGQLDEDAIFYLRSRGIGAEAARSLLTYAFASDIVERIKVESVREDLAELLFHRLPQGEIVRQAV